MPTFAATGITSLGVAGVNLLQVSATGVGFNGGAPAAKPTLPPNATDLPTAITLLNAIKSALISYGLAQ